MRERRALVVFALVAAVGVLVAGIFLPLRSINRHRAQDVVISFPTSSTSSSTTSSTTSTSVVSAPTPPAPPRSTIPRPLAAGRGAPAAAGGTARASWYGEGSGTASGEAFNPGALTFASRTMPFGTHVRFCHGGQCVVAKCNDRGPFVAGRLFDLSRATFAAIAPLGAGVITVDWQVV